MRRPWWIAGVALAAIGLAAGAAYFGFGNRMEAAAVSAPATQQAAPSAAETAAQPRQTADNSTQPALYPDDAVLGSDQAPITMIEYASLTCPHCASFHNLTLPQIKTNYIDKGLVRLVYRDFPLDGTALRAALLAHCAPKESYFAMLEVLFRSQDDWALTSDPLKALAQIGRTAGIDQPAFDACMADDAAKTRIIERVQEAAKTFNIESTPSFVINGQKRSGAASFEEFDKVLKDLLPKS